jgi:hypothetical protein
MVLMSISSMRIVPASISNIRRSVEMREDLPLIPYQTNVSDFESEGELTYLFDRI